jgi:8-oxo-dGTP pyrophosphatase MutT (NUDIX family)
MSASPSNPFVQPYKIRCTNCNQQGHHIRHCEQPVSSYGVIAFRVTDSSWNQVAALHGRGEVLPLDKIQFLMVQRRNTYGFVEIIRGKYKTNDLSYLRTIIAETTKVEQDALLSQSFETLWKNMWGVENKNYKHDFEMSREKFLRMSAGVEDPHTKQRITLAQLIHENKSSWPTPEWGFPKGKPNLHESTLETAEREFCEETGLMTGDFHIFENIYPFQENFYGTNQTQYKHVYYLAYMMPSVAVRMNHEDAVMAREIGDIAWFSYSDALAHIRDYNNEKKELLLQVHKVLRDYIPLLIGPAVACVGALEEEEPINREQHVAESVSKKSHIVGGKSYASAARGSGSGSAGSGSGPCGPAGGFTLAGQLHERDPSCTVDICI